MLAKSKSNSIEGLISKAVINSYISHDEFVLINNMLKGLDDMTGEIKNSNDKWKFKLCYLIVWSVEKIQKVKIKKL